MTRQNERIMLSRKQWPCLLMSACLVSVLFENTASAFRPSLANTRDASRASATYKTITFSNVVLHQSTTKGSQPELPLPTRTKKHHKKRNKKGNASIGKKTGVRFKGQALARDEVAHHVASAYIMGYGGVLDKDKLKSERIQKNSPGQKSKLVYSIDSDGENRRTKQMETLKMLERLPALVLNADYQPMSHLPLSMWNWQDAIKGIFSGKVTVVDVYPDVTIRAANIEVPLPSVIAMNEYVKKCYNKPAFTRKNVFLRDKYTCQYCNKHFRTNDLSLDHVVPRCRGGHLCWENAVTCCTRCNCRKGSLSVAQLRNIGMRLSRKPYAPTQLQLASSAGLMLPRRVHPTWDPYLGRSSGSKIKDSYDRQQQITQGEREIYLDDLEIS